MIACPNKKQRKKDNFNVATNIDFDVDTSSSSSKAIYNHKTGIMRIREMLKIIVSFQRSTSWMVGMRH